jgi:hypothetical protein
MKIFFFTSAGMIKSACACSPDSLSFVIQRDEEEQEEKGRKHSSEFFSEKRKKRL